MKGASGRTLTISRKTVRPPRPESNTRMTGETGAVIELKPTGGERTKGRHYGTARRSRGGGMIARPTRSQTLPRRSRAVLAENGERRILRLPAAALHAGASR